MQDCPVLVFSFRHSQIYSGKCVRLTCSDQLDGVKRLLQSGHGYMTEGFGRFASGDLERGGVQGRRFWGRPRFDLGGREVLSSPADVEPPGARLCAWVARYSGNKASSPEDFDATVLLCRGVVVASNMGMVGS